jgi:hypothetical protein
VGTAPYEVVKLYTAVGIAELELELELESDQMTLAKKRSEVVVVRLTMRSLDIVLDQVEG